MSDPTLNSPLVTASNETYAPKITGVTLIEPTELYNILQQAKFYPCLSDPNYLILLDLRAEFDYKESHIITARRPAKTADENLSVPFGSVLDCKKHVIVYDNKTSKLDKNAPIIIFSESLWEEGSRYPVKVLSGGYQRFSALYPFLRTQKIMYTIRELDDLQTYPYEIIPAKLYLGNFKHACLAYIHKEMDISAHINCSQLLPPKIKRVSSVLHISKADESSMNLRPFFEAACDFIDNSQIVLIFSEFGISRSVTIVIAYLMKHKKYSFKEAYNFAKNCCQFIQPLLEFMHQLSEWEAVLNPPNTPSFDTENATDAVETEDD